MSQFDFGTIDPYVVDGVQLADMLNNWHSAVHSWHRGASRPSYVVPGMMWINDAGGAANWIVNVYLSPTIGDKPVFTYDTTTGNITLSAAAGGTLASAILLAQAATSPSVRWQATGNPIDQKNWRQTLQPDGTLRLAAYNDAGVETAFIIFNRDGSIGGSQAVPRLAGEVVSTAGATSLKVSFPALPKVIELYFQMILATTPAADQAGYLQLFNGSTGLGGTSYYTQVVSGYSGNTIAGALTSAGPYWGLGNANFLSGVARINIVPGTSSFMTFQAVAQTQAGLVVSTTGAGPVSVTASQVNSAQMGMGVAALLAGSWLRAVVIS